jgi:hypothetical protein
MCFILWRCQCIVAFYGRETWFFILREEIRPKLPENRVMRIFGPERNEIIRGWRKLHNDELHNLQSLQKYN